MLSKLRSRVSGYTGRVGEALGRLGLHPNHVTLMGFALASASACFYGYRRAVLGGVLLLLSGAMDVLDGAVARATGKVTEFGGILDSTLDRYGEALVYLGIAVALAPAYLGVLALFSSLMVSYVRARAEATGKVGRCDVGFFERAERILTLVASSLMYPFWHPSIFYGLWVISILCQVTVVQRLYCAWRRLR